MLLLLSIAFSAAAFLTLDWFRSAAILRRSKSTLKPNSCRVRDPVRHHALKPNCASMEHWGRDSYEFFTNSLGFRDEKIREVPLTDARPRILILGDSFTEGRWRGVTAMSAESRPTSRNTTSSTEAWAATPPPTTSMWHGWCWPRESTSTRSSSSSTSPMSRTRPPSTGTLTPRGP